MANQSRHQVHPLLTQDGQVAVNAAKGSRSGDIARAAGNLLLHLDQANVVFSQAVVEAPRQALSGDFQPRFAVAVE